MAGLYGKPGYLWDIIRGVTIDFPITIKNKDTGDPIDLTGSKFYVTLSTKISPEDDPALEIIIDPPTHPLLGKTIVKITDTQTYALVKGTYYYSIRYVNSNGDTYVIDLGRIKVLDGVSGRIA